MTITNLIIWTLLGVLLLWICLFAFLALRPEGEKIADEPSHVFTTQALVTHVAQSQASASTPIHEQVGEPVPMA